jgi:excisionase family DNA binding protein
MKLLTVKELGRILGVTAGTVYRMVGLGRIPTIRIGTGRSLRFDLDQVKEALAGALPTHPSFHEPGVQDPLLTLAELAVETGIKDLAQNHDHYLYGVPLK